MALGSGIAMKRWVVGGVIVLLLVLVVGVVLTYIPKLRRAADETACKKNLHELGLFAAQHTSPDPKLAGRKLAIEIPPGTVVLPNVPPADRLSWYVVMLPGLDQKRQNMEPLLAAIDPAAPWTAERNQTAARIKLLVALCPGNTPVFTANQPALTSYVGIAGIGPDAAALPLPPAPAPASPRAGCFRYDGVTPFDAITDGLSQTLLLGERSGDVGPWLRGGPATVRGFDIGPNAAPVLGVGAQFGGCHLTGANWALADGSVRFMLNSVDPKILFGLATIAGHETDPVPGE